MMYRQYSYHLVLTRSFSFCIFTKQYFALLIVRKKCDTNPNYRNVFFPQSKECDPQFYFRIFLIYLKRKRKYYALSRRKREQEIGELIYRALHISVDCVASTGMKAQRHRAKNGNSVRKKMDSLNANGNNTREFCNIQYKHFVAYGGMLL